MTALTPGGHVDEARRYVLESRIATGGMGEVWSARDTVLDRPVAVKVLKTEYADDPLFRQRFETEARHAAALQHPGIASVYDYGASSLDDGSSTPRPYLVMELVEGQPLSALLRPAAPLDPDVARDLVAQAATALGVAHAAGIVHRDVKPANLLVTPDRRVKVTDFGIARAAEGMGLTQTGEVMGTPAYICPEQAEGGTATAASDVYSLGVVAFECLVGAKPFVADSPVATAIAHLRNPVPELPGSVPADLAAVVRRSLSKAPGDRYADGAAFAQALRDPGSAAATTVVAPAVAPVVADGTQVMPVAPRRPARPRPRPRPRANGVRRRQCRGPSCSASPQCSSRCWWPSGSAPATPSRRPARTTRAQTPSNDAEPDERDPLGDPVARRLPRLRRRPPARPRPRPSRPPSRWTPRPTSGATARRSRRSCATWASSRSRWSWRTPVTSRTASWRPWSRRARCSRATR